MKRKTFLILKCILFAFFTLFISCTYVDLTGMSNDIQLKQSLVVPVGEDSLSVNDLLKKMNLHDITTFGDTIKLSAQLNKNYQFSDTIKNVKDILNKIDKATLFLQVTNDLPVKISFKINFLNATNNVINEPSINDSTYIIRSAQINSKGIVITNGATVTNTKITLTSTQTAALNNAMNMVYTISITAEDQNKPIQFISTNYFKVKLGVFVTGKYTTTLGSNK